MTEKISIAKQLINSKNLEEAIDILNTYKKEESNSNWEVFFELGKIYYIKRDFKKAIYNFKQSIVLKDSVYTKLLLAKSLKEFNRNFRALRLFLNLRKIDANIQKEVDTEVINLFLNKQLYFPVLKYIDKYNIKNLSLKEKILNLFIAQIGILNFNGDSDNAKKISLKALKKLKNISIKTKNSLLNEIEISDNRINLKSYPRFLKLGITQNCNLRCKMCRNHMEKTPYGRLTKTKLKILETLFRYAEFVEWQGGEPLSYKHIEYFIDLANKNNVKQGMITNGLLLNEILIKKIMSYNFELTLSIDSVNKSIYENIRYGGKFDTLLKNIKLIYKNKKIYNNNSKFKLNAVLSRWNYQNKNNFIDLLYFASKYNFTDMDIYCDVQEQDVDLKMKYIDVFNLDRDKLLKLAKDYNINLSIQVPINRYNNIKDNKLSQISDKNIVFEKYCLLPWKKVYIHFDKLISVDCSCPKIGILESNTRKFFIEKIWNGADIVKIRKRIIENKLDNIIKICGSSNYSFLRKG